MRELKFKAFHIPTKTMYWFDLMWGNNGHGNGYIGMAPFGEPMTKYKHRDNLINVDPTDCELMQFTGLHHQGTTEVYQDDVLYDEIEHDHGDERLFYVITWINERASFAFLTAQERKDYDEQGLSAIDRDFEGFYYELDQDSLDKMHLKGNIHDTEPTVLI